MQRPARSIIALLGGLALVAAACGSEDATTTESAQAAPDAPTVVVTTNILADVVENVAGGQVNVVTLMPVGADPHDFQASAQQVAAISDAAALIVNGEGFEEGLLDVIEGAESDGVAVYEAISAVSTIEFGEGGHDHEDHGEEEHGDEEHGDEEHSDDDHDDHGDEEHGDEEHSDDDHDDHGDEEHGDEEHSDEEHEDHDHEHDHDGADPHFWQDPARMASAADGIADFLSTVDGVDADAIAESVAGYVAELEALDAEIAEALAGVDESDRVLITNHDSFGYFGDRFGFEIVGTVIPSGSTADGTSAQQLSELAELMRDEGVSAVFAETTASNDLAEALADEVGADVAVVELFTGSLGEADSGADTYVTMLRTNAERIADALAG